MKKQNPKSSNAPVMILMGMESGPEIKWVKCPKCEGSGQVGGGRCSACDGKGKVKA